MAATAPERAGATTVDLDDRGHDLRGLRGPDRAGPGPARRGGLGQRQPAAEWATVTYDPALTGPPAFAAKVADLGYAVGRDPPQPTPHTVHQEQP
jgi:hypothetical protein